MQIPSRNLKHVLLLAFFLGLASTANAATFVVSIGNFFFRTTNLVINVNDSVLWTNVSSNPHDATHGTTTTPAASRLWASPQMAQGQTFSLAFPNAGFFPYICKLHTVDNTTHPEQTGTVSVVTGNLPPIVHITSPANGSSVINQPFLTITANAADTNGAVSKVDFLSGTNLLGTDTTAPYSLLASNLLGIQLLTAVATDNLGLSTTSATVSVTVTNRASTNTINIQSFAFSPQLLTVTAGSLVTWTNRDTPTGHTITGNAASLEPLCGSGIVLSAGLKCTNRFMTPGVYPYFCSIHPSMVGTVVVIRAGSTPFVNLTAPGAGSTFAAGSPITFAATASDADGVARVDFFHSGNSPIGTDAVAPYSVSSALAAGNYFVFAKVVDTIGFGVLTPQVPISVSMAAELRLSFPQLGGDGTMQFDLNSVAGLTYIVEQSPVLPAAWLPLSTNLATGAVLRVIDPTPVTGQTQRVYRAFQQP